ncbi:MAG: HAMP domain-containing histidine kinase, partial [Pseudomonadota bacterium]|nr:HAMP domain-containing histidine kinase [Pseudomonadota bacterium]
TTITLASEIQDMVRFNEAIDQAQSESMGRYASMLREAQTLFLSILGHDVRTPLGAISMGAQVLLRDPASSAQAVKVGHRIFNSSQRVADIVRDLLDFSTTHLGEGIPIEPLAVDLGKLCEDVVEEVRMFHPERKITLQVAGEVEGPYDAARMAQVFSNLLANAVQHGHPDSTIRVGLGGDQEAIRFTVQNDAALIAPEKLRTFFDPVRRFAIRPSSERIGAGAAHLGLGLYVVKEIVRAHGGTVTVTSTAAGG